MFSWSDFNARRYGCYCDEPMEWTTDIGFLWYYYSFFLYDNTCFELCWTTFRPDEKTVELVFRAITIISGFCVRCDGEIDGDLSDDGPHSSRARRTRESSTFNLLRDVFWSARMMRSLIALRVLIADGLPAYTFNIVFLSDAAAESSKRRSNVDITNKVQYNIPRLFVDKVEITRLATKLLSRAAQSYGLLRFPFCFCFRSDSSA